MCNICAHAAASCANQCTNGTGFFRFRSVPFGSVPEPVPFFRFRFLLGVSQMMILQSYTCHCMKITLTLTNYLKVDFK
jgi:hypothetical protein